MTEPSVLQLNKSHLNVITIGSNCVGLITYKNVDIKKLVKHYYTNVRQLLIQYLCKNVTNIIMTYLEPLLVEKSNDFTIDKVEFI